MYGQHAQTLAKSAFLGQKASLSMNLIVRQNPYIRVERSDEPHEAKSVTSRLSQGGIFIKPTERELPPKAKRLQTARRNPQRQVASRSISLLEI